MQLEFHDVQSGHPGSRFCFQDLRLHLLVFLPIFLLPFFHSVPFLDGMVHFTGKLNAYCIQFHFFPITIGIHNCFDHLDGLGHRPADNRVGYLVEEVAELFHFAVCSMKIQASCLARLVIAHPLLQKRNEFAHCSYGKLGTFRDGKRQQCFMVLLWDSLQTKGIYSLCV